MVGRRRRGRGGRVAQLSDPPNINFQSIGPLPPLPEVGCPIFLEIRNPLGKVMERSGLTFEHFCLEMV